MDDVAKTPLDETRGKEKEVEIPSDNPITKQEEDLLDRKPFVENVVSLIKTNIKPPYSIGIYGDWGSGKTSIMRLVEEKITETGQYRIIWFDAWEYENETNIIYPLVRLIQKEMPPDKLGELGQTMGRLRSTILKTVGDAFLGRITAGTVSIKEIQKHWEDYIEKHTGMFDKWIDQISEIKEEFRTLTEAACEPKEKEEGKKECIIIFIDDLDRCLPENSIKILESVKNVFSQGKCIFILGVDKRTVARVIKDRYTTLTEAEGMNYLDKIISYGFDVPGLGALYFEGYFKYLMYDKLKIDSKVFAVNLGDVSKICVSSKLHNPRRIKRGVIAFYLYTKIRQSRGFYDGLEGDIKKENITHQDVLMFCLFHEFWSDLFERVLIVNHELAELTGVALSRGFRDWSTQFSDDRTYPILKSFAADHNLYRFLRDWQNPQTDNIVDTLVRIARLIELK